MELALKTDRLTLKPLAQSDFETFYRIAADAFVRRFLFDDEILPPERVREFITRSEKNFAENHYGLWLIVSNESAESLGFAGLWTFFDEPQPQLIYALLPEFTRRGFAAEAAERIIRYCFSELSFQYLIASCDAPNIASQRVAERLGMKKIKEETIDGLPTVFFIIKNK